MLYNKAAVKHVACFCVSYSKRLSIFHILWLFCCGSNTQKAVHKNMYMTHQLMYILQENMCCNTQKHVHSVLSYSQNLMILP